ncbi:T9SS type B sorting domain-containing protein [Aestuariivivens sediminicola]|uniref:T9SS type B sorting domain-containing protein n=1 Tax=Aestuariivivens sediminicola TaxID=2913560 RepID=UPI001F562FA9|nr:T9SS type B sorting domain-containing protein [Aestuariivivens sediminicola]
MNKTTYVKSILVVLCFLSFGLTAFAQAYKPFSLRKQIEERGSMLVVGNAILGENNNDFNDLTRDNQDISMQYIDIDSDASTFSSSSADLQLHLQEDGSPTTCYRVAYAGLYWGAILQSGSRADIDKVKFKLPGTTDYIDITGEIIYDAIVDPIPSEPGEPGNTPYACYAEVTDLLSGLTDIEGAYTVANVTSGLGLNNSTGLAAGWTLIVIYEDPNLHMKSFNIFDGFSHIYDGHQETVPVTGFATPPAGNIDLQFAYAALDGDRTKRATKLEINGKEVTTPFRSANKFFGSVIENENGVSHPRVPNSANTLGYDTGFLEIINSEPEFIKNGDTSADFRLQVARGQADPIFAFLGAFAVDIIAPDIDLTKTVHDEFGNDIDGADVYLGDRLFYEITYQSVGNDNVTEFTIKDVLPDNIIFDPNTDIDLSNAGGATLLSWDPVTRTLIFSIPDESVEVDDPAFVIRLAVQVVPNCYDLSQACSNEVANQAFATYRGVINPTLIEEEGSFATVECLGVPGSTNFIVDISDCEYQKTEILCGSSVVLTAASGYDTYSWSTSPTGTPVIGTGQTYTATEVGTYYVTNTTNSTCISIQEEITVALYGNTQTNPVIPYADLLPVCPNDGKVLPYIFLCGANETRAIATGISDAVSIVWEQLDESSCPAMTVDDCANENDACTWNQVGTGPDYVANTSGEFRLVINYPGGCFSIFYFNVYQNLLNPTITAEDIICTTPGQVTVGGVPSGYEYSLDPNGPYQASNVFTVNTPGYYTVYIQQTVADSFPCTFQTPSIYVRQRDANLTTVVTQPDCNGDKGSIQLQVNDALPQYYYTLTEGGTLISSVGPIADSNYTFDNLNPGTYTYNVTTDDGCVFTGDIDILDPPFITVTAALTQPLTCTDGEITIYPDGGTPPYNYFINSTTVSQDYPEYVVTAAGTYTITVIDFNGCEATTSIDVEGILPPEFTISQADILCADDPNSGSITINVTNANGNSLMYSIDNGASFVSSNVFTGLAEGTYDVLVQYTYDADICATFPQAITITAQAPITGSAALTAPYTCTSNGEITVSGVTGGTAPYEYSIDGINFQSGTTFTGLTNGTYTVTIRDASGCSAALAPITIDPLDPPTDMDFSSTALTCPTNTSDVSITVTGGTSPLEYQIIAPSSAVTAYQSSNVFTGLAPGTYTFQVNDANDCTYSESYTIDPLPTLTVVGLALNNVTCFGASDGTAEFTVSGTTSFTYTINGGASVAGTSTINLSGLAAGSYTILITDSATNCTATDTVTIDGPPSALTVTATESPITCDADGNVTITATGGWGGYSFELVQPDSSVLGPQGSAAFGGLSQIGTYTVNVTDANGCVASTTFDLNTPGNPTATISNADYCYDASNGASLEVSASGGNPPYEYSINGSAFQSNNVFSNLIPGTYDIIVRDAYGCTYTLPTETISDQLTASASLTKGLDCSVNPDAEVNVTVSGGTAPYSYEVSHNGGAFTATGNPPYTYNSAETGDYQYRITDAQGCTALTNVITIQPITNPSATATATDVFCNGDASGIVTIDVDETAGTPPYEISFNGSAYTAQTVYNGLVSGTYNYMVRDSNSCVFNGSVTVNEPNPVVLGSEIITPITCGVGGNVLGSIQILNVTGGTPDYTYTLLDSSGAVAATSSTNPFGPTPNDNVTFNDLIFGNYYLRIVDANGCEYNFGPYLVASDVDNLDILANGGGTCIAGVEYNISIVNGTGPFRVRIYDGTTTFTPADGVAPNGLPTSDVSPNERNHQFTGLLFDVSYVFEVLDTSTNCTYIEQVPAVPSPSTIGVTGTPTNVSCYELPALSNGSFDFTVSGYDGSDLSWEVFENLSNTTTGITGNAAGLTGSDYSDSVSGLAPGDYYLLVTETDLSSTQCTAIVYFQITEPTELLLAEVENTNANCNQDAQVAVNASGGTPPYEYAFVVDAILPTTGDWTTSNLAFLDPATSLDWDVYVRDSNGCTILVPLDITIASDPVPTVTLPSIADDQCSSDGSAYTFTATPGGGEITPVTYSIDGVSFQSSPTFTVTSTGTYTVTIRDGNGCTATDTITIYPPLQVNAQVTGLPSCSNNDGIITATGYGGSGNYTYEITSGPVLIGPQASNVFNGLPNGTYTITIADTTTLCTSDTTILLDPATPVAFTLTASDVSCNGGTDGSITVNLPASNDNPPYTYEITSGPVLAGPQSSNLFTGLPAGNYDITVTSGRNCSTTEPITIGEPLLLDVSGSATDFSCAADNSVNTSILTITETGGTAPYTYSIDGTNYFTTNTFEIIDNGSVQSISIYVTDANGCMASNSVSINPLPELTIATAAIATPIDCNNTGTVTISVTGGSGNFSYELLPGGTPQVSNTFAITDPGTYYFRVTDIDTGCSIDTSPLTIAPYDTIEVTALATTAVTCFGDSDGTLELTVSGYTGTYSYEVFDSTGASVSGIVAADTSTNPQIITGISGGNYYVEVTETSSPFCAATSNTVTIDSPSAPLALSVSETSNVTCDDNQGSINAVASGGWGNYQYELTGAATVPYSSNGTFSNLSAGSYTVNVMDAGGCVVSENITLNLPTPIDATIAATPTLLNCFGDANATITVSNVTGGQGSNYSYTLNRTAPTVSSSGPQTTPVFTNLGAGTYNVTITDGYNCSFTTPDVVIDEPTQVTASLVTASTQTCVNDAMLTLSATGGTGTYEYSDTPTFTTVLGSFTTSTTFTVSVGSHAFYVRDANGCVAAISNEITIEPLEPLTVILDTTNATVNCAGDATGVIVAEAQGGLGNYVYTLQDDAGNDIIGAIQNSPGVFTDLPIGTYQVHVESVDCEVTSAAVIITEPSEPLVAQYTVSDVTCNGENDGIIEVIASGGTGIIKYAITPRLDQFFDEAIFDELSPGVYDIIVQDELGCYVLLEDIEIIEAAPVILSIVPNSILPEVCEGDMNGEFSIDISGGTLPYSVALDDINGTYTVGGATQTQFDFTGLVGGDHIVYVRDAQGCESEWNITFPESVRIDPELTIEFGCVNNLSTNTITVTIDDSLTNPADVDYSLNGGPYQASNVFTDVPPGMGHYIDVRHTNGCIQSTEPFDIPSYEPLEVVLVESSNINEIEAIATGGTGEYEFEFNGESTGSTNTFQIYETGNYTVVVTDSNGCTATASGYFEFVDICIPNYFVPGQEDWGPGCGKDSYKNLTVDIYDRYGRVVARLRVSDKWDGKYNGRELPTGDYWYVVKLNDDSDDRDFVGHFTLYR